MSEQSEGSRPKLSVLDHAVRDLMLEVEHQLRFSQNKFFGSVKLELTYNDGTLSLVKVSSERTMKTEKSKLDSRPRLTQG